MSFKKWRNMIMIYRLNVSSKNGVAYEKKNTCEPTDWVSSMVVVKKPHNNKLP